MRHNPLTLPPVITLIGGSVIWASAIWFDRPSLPILAIIGGLIICGALGLIGWSILYFRRQKTPVMPNRTPTDLISGGPFGFSRNPIYLGMALALVGWSIWQAEWIGLLVTAGFIAWVTASHIRPEEKVVKATFGDQATRYFETTPRWIGPL